MENIIQSETPKTSIRHRLTLDTNTTTAREPEATRENYVGIDYGMGRSNVDKVTGIRYGVIAQNSLDQEAFNDAWMNARDLSHEAAMQTLVQHVAQVAVALMLWARDLLGQATPSKSHSPESSQIWCNQFGRFWAESFEWLNKQK
jgi:hypothetical protein